MALKPVFGAMGFDEPSLPKGKAGLGLSMFQVKMKSPFQTSTLCFAKSARFWVEFDRSFYMFGLLLTKNRGKYPNDKTKTKTDCLLYTNNGFDGECG